MSIPTLAPNNQLNVQGVQSSNISGTPIISSFPTTNTSNSLGHYHFVDDTTKASTHLNVSSTSSGGHIFSHASSTQAPLTVLKIDRTALTLDTLLRNSTAKTYLDMSLGELKLINDTYNNTINQGFMSMNDVVNNYIGAYTAEQVNLVNNSTSFQTRVYAGQTQISNNTTDLNVGTPTYLEISNIPKTIKSTLTKTNLSITDISNNVSVLSPTDLTFNGVSVFSNIDILAQKLVVPQMIVSSPAIYADSSIAPQPSPFLATYGFGGWAYLKASPQASNAKINWYLPFPVIGGTVGDLYGLYYQIFNNCLGTGDLPFYTVYTRPLGDGSDYASWYHSSMTYVPDSNSTANQTCQMFMNIKSLSFTPNSIGIQNQINMSQSTVNNPRGTYADTDVILFIAFGTNSGSALNSVDFSCSKIGMITNNFSAEYNLL
jgi:hypothetical protein